MISGSSGFGSRNVKDSLPHASTYRATLAPQILTARVVRRRRLPLSPPPRTWCPQGVMARARRPADKFKRCRRWHWIQTMPLQQVAPWCMCARQTDLEKRPGGELDDSSFFSHAGGDEVVYTRCRRFIGLTFFFQCWGGFFGYFGFLIVMVEFKIERLW